MLWKCKKKKKKLEPGSENLREIPAHIRNGYKKDLKPTYKISLGLTKEHHNHPANILSCIDEGDSDRMAGKMITHGMTCDDPVS